MNVNLCRGALALRFLVHRWTQCNTVIIDLCLCLTYERGSSKVASRWNHACRDELSLVNTLLSYPRDLGAGRF
jgi:hypothetical protein